VTLRLHRDVTLTGKETLAADVYSCAAAMCWSRTEQGIALPLFAQRSPKPNSVVDTSRTGPV
jgi:hypothetical protein